MLGSLVLGHTMEQAEALRARPGRQDDYWSALGKRRRLEIEVARRTDDDHQWALGGMHRAPQLGEASRGVGEGLLGRPHTAPFLAQRSGADDDRVGCRT